MTYQVINSIVIQSDARLSAAEAHGMATGLLCVNDRVQSDHWLTELLRNALPINDEQRGLLDRLFEETRRLLTSDDFEFDLLLPDDDSPLAEQIEALKNWCVGFLAGVGFGQPRSNWPGDVGEILKDIVEFTKLETEDVSGEEEESAFVEVSEYLRSAVMLLRDELNTGVKTLH
ncbi:MAG: UPF0149 family protein [Methylococcales bacterium]